jgi:glycine betaine/proline transport system substrate-binding protein
MITRARFAPGLVAVVLATVPALAQDASDPIRLTLHDWTGQLITTRIMGSVLQEAGLAVEYVPADYLAQFAGLRSGDLHVAMEVWETTGREALDEAVASGGVENLGESGMTAIEEWWYPAYVNEACPGLPDWEALKEPACAEAFATAETAPDGRYLGGPVTWGGFDEERVEALDLSFVVIHAGTDAALFAELESANQRKAPIMLWAYAPHWAPIKYEGEWVAFPPFDPACYEDPAWGVNPDATHDCGKPRGPIWKAGWSGVKDTWPTAYAAIRAFTVTNEEMGDMIAGVDFEGAGVDAVVAAWMDANEDRWKGWIGQ